ncbi:hypothetical protein INR49_020116 [Caranx melampygus]|nr:hypothetical protein INR49_020116 [Caranx melampygus]
MTPVLLFLLFVSLTAIPVDANEEGEQIGIVQHEVLHALGFHHEQVRSDRDQHVNILFHNIQEGKESNFRKVDTNNLATPYDFQSVMHYSKYAFSKNWQPTIVAKRDPNLNFGQATSMSTNDIARGEELDTCCSQQQTPVTTDSSSDTSVVIARANEGITTRLIHGDIVPNMKRNADPCTATGCKWPKRGRYVIIPVVISRSYTRRERITIIRGLVSFYRKTCIRFVRKNWWHHSYLYFFSGSGCWSYLGRQRGRQLISLRRNGCLYTDTVQHEVLHALGFHHEQVRSDRDQHVNILFENILEGTESNFQKVNTNNLGTPYDFQSVMHYSNYAFSKNGQPTIVAKSDPNLVFGRAESMSDNDIARKQNISDRWSRSAFRHSLL